jgi:hypothetical protein
MNTNIRRRIEGLEARETKGRTYDIWYGIKTREEVEADLQRRRETGEIGPHDVVRPLFWEPLECDRGL